MVEQISKVKIKPEVEGVTAGLPAVQTITSLETIRETGGLQGLNETQITNLQDMLTQLQFELDKTGTVGVDSFNMVKASIDSLIEGTGYAISNQGELYYVMSDEMVKNLDTMVDKSATANDMVVVSYQNSADEIKNIEMTKAEASELASSLATASTSLDAFSLAFNPTTSSPNISISSSARLVLNAFCL